MSALADALVAAQARVVAALAKQYVGGAADDVTVRAALESVGLTDEVDTTRLLASWDILRAAGATPPNEQRVSVNGDAKPENEKASDAQLALIAKLVQERNQPGPDLPVTKAQAHEIIDTLKAGTYDVGRWRIPFE